MDVEKSFEKLKHSNTAMKPNNTKFKTNNNGFSMTKSIAYDTILNDP
jgi:hypothetical protein